MFDEMYRSVERETSETMVNQQEDYDGIQPTLSMEERGDHNVGLLARRLPHL